MFNPPDPGERWPEVGHLPAVWAQMSPSKECRWNICRSCKLVPCQGQQSCDSCCPSLVWLLAMAATLITQGCLSQGRDSPSSLPPRVSILFPSHMPLFLPSHLCFSASPHTKYLSSLQKLPRMSTAEAEFAIHTVMSDHFGAYQLHLLLKCFVSKLSTKSN